MTFKIRLGHGEVAIGADADKNNEVFIDFLQLFEQFEIGSQLGGVRTPNIPVGKIYFDNRNSFAQLRRSIDAAEALLTWMNAQEESPTREQVQSFMREYTESGA